MQARHKVQISLLGNVLVLVIVVTLLGVFDAGSFYWRIGWSDTLTVVSVKIDSPERYGLLFFVIFLVEAIRVAAENIGAPEIEFTVFNPDTHIVTSLTRTELHVYANLLAVVANIRKVLVMMVELSQIDVALWTVACGALGNVLSVWFLLHNKQINRPATADQAIELTAEDPSSPSSETQSMI
jgi:hypothetical protein